MTKYDRYIAITKANRLAFDEEKSSGKADWSDKISGSSGSKAGGSDSDTKDSKTQDKRR